MEATKTKNTTILAKKFLTKEETVQVKFIIIDKDKQISENSYQIKIIAEKFKNMKI